MRVDYRQTASALLIALAAATTPLSAQAGLQAASAASEAVRRATIRSPADGARHLVGIGAATIVELPRDFDLPSAERFYFERDGMRLDLYARRLTPGEPIYIELLSNGQPGRHRLTLDDKTIPLTRTSFGQRGLWGIDPHEKEKVLPLCWHIDGIETTRAERCFALRLGEAGFAERVRRVRQAPPGQAAAAVTPTPEQIERQRQRQERIASEQQKKQRAFARRTPDRLSNRLSHPRDMHFITSPFFIRRVNIPYHMEGNRRVEGTARVRYHRGLDFRGRPGTPIFALADGTVAISENMTFEGNFIVIDHGNGIFTGYMHQTRTIARVGERVEAGQLIGTVGNTGYSFGPHLHLSLWIHGVPLDPLSLLSLPIRN